MRVALATWDWPSFAGGGAAQLLETIALGLSEHGVSVEVWTRGGGTRGSGARRQSNGLLVRHLSGRSWARRGGEHWKRQIRSLVSDFQPDLIVVSPWDPLPGILRGLGSDSRPPIWVFAHGREITASMSASRESVRSEILRGGFRWLCLTEWMAGQLQQRGVPEADVTVVPAAVRPPSLPEGAGEDLLPTGLVQSPDLSGAAAAPFRLLSVGRLIDRKGHDVVLRALAQLDCSMLHYDLVGRGPSLQRLIRLASELGLEGKVSFHGWVEGAEFERAWARADLFTMIPREEAGGDTEGYGLVYLEAASRGVPSLGSASAGAAEAIEEGVDGVKVGDPLNVEEVAAAIERLRVDDELRWRLARNSIARYEERGRPEHLAARLVDVFSEDLAVVSSVSDSSVAEEWVVAVRAAMPSPRPQAWQAFQQALGLAEVGLSEVILVADAALPDGGPSTLQDWLGRPLPQNFRAVVPQRWHRPPAAGLLFRKNLRALRSPSRTLLCRDPRVAAAEAGKWKKVLLEWHVRPSPGQRGHAEALTAADVHIVVSEGLRADLLQLGVRDSRVALVPNACGLSRARASRRWRGAVPSSQQLLNRGLNLRADDADAGAQSVPSGAVLALGLHRRGGLDQALRAWSSNPHLPPLLLAGRDQGAQRLDRWVQEVENDPSLRGRVHFLGPVWGEAREDLLDSVALWLCLYPRDEDSFERLCPLQVADAAGSGLPVVASDLPSIRRQLGGEWSEFARVEDPESLAAAVRRGLDSVPPNPLQRPRWNDRAKRLIQLS